MSITVKLRANWGGLLKRTVGGEEILFKPGVTVELTESQAQSLYSDLYDSLTPLGDDGNPMDSLQFRKLVKPPEENPAEAKPVVETPAPAASPEPVATPEEPAPEAATAGEVDP